MRQNKAKLAIDGGTPIRSRPLPPMYPGAMATGAEELTAAEEVIRSRSLFRYYGPHHLDRCRTFERNLASCVGTKHALGVNSGTSALHCALVALGVGPGDEVLLPTYAWAACPAAVVACGAECVFVNIDRSLTMDPEDLEERVTRRSKAILVVHMRGLACDMDRILRIADVHDLPVIEDSSQAAGGTYGGSYSGQRIGSVGRVGTFSFQSNKMISAGEGGALVTNDRALYERAWLFHDVGAPYRLTWPASKRVSDLLVGVEDDSSPAPKPMIGLNYRMTELTAALLIAQLKRLPNLVGQLQTNVHRVSELIRDLPDVELRTGTACAQDVGICLAMLLPSPQTARAFSDALRAENVYVEGGEYPRVPYVPGSTDGHVVIHWQHIVPAIARTLRAYEPSLRLLERVVHVDLSPLMTAEDVESVGEGIRKVSAALVTPTPHTTDLREKSQRKE